MSLREQVEELCAKGGGYNTTDREVFEAFKQALNHGEAAKPSRERAVCVSVTVSAAESKPTRCVPGMWPARVEATGTSGP